MQELNHSNILLGGDIEENPGPYSITVPVTTQNIDFGSLAGKAGQVLAVNTLENAVAFTRALPTTTTGDAQKVLYVKSDLTYGIGTFGNYRFNNITTMHVGSNTINTDTLGNLTGTMSSDGNGWSIKSTTPTMATNNTTLKSFYTVKISSLDANAFKGNWGFQVGVCKSARSSSLNSQDFSNVLVCCPRNNSSTPTNNTTHHIEHFQTQNQTGVTTNVTFPNSDWFTQGGSGSLFMSSSRWVGCHFSFGIDNTVSPKKVWCWIHNASQGLIGSASQDLNSSFNNDSTLTPYISGNAWTDSNRNYSLRICNGGESPSVSGWSYIYPQFSIS